MLGVTERQWVATAVAIVAACFGQYYASYAIMVAGGFVAGAIATQSWRGGVMGAMTAAIGAGLGGGGAGFGEWAVRTFVGGVMGSLQGGNFGHSFVTAGLTAAFMPQIGKISNDVGRVVVTAIVGGTISELTGGKFANGAVTGAIMAAMAGSSEAAEDEDQLAARRGTGKWTAAGVRRVFEKSEAGKAFLEEFGGDPVSLIKFDRATDTYTNADGIKKVVDLSQGLQGSYQPRTKTIRLNASLTTEQAALTLYHEYKHHLGANELNARIFTEQFAINAGLGVSSPGYRTSANTVNSEAIRLELAPGGALSKHYSSQQKVRAYQGERNVAF